MNFLFLIISLIASAIGAICGIGGGVIIKPLLDAVSDVSVATASFLSGCTVLAMSFYSVTKGFVSKDSRVDFKTGTPLAFGAAIGGVFGKFLFEYVSGLFSNVNRVGAVQAGVLLIVTAATLLYTVWQNRIHTYRVQNAALCIICGSILGVLSSFLGIGGGPVNLVILSFLFSMDIKKAAQNSLYIILFSQITNLFATLLTKRVPDFDWLSLITMILGGILGGVIGRIINKKIDHNKVRKLFFTLMVGIICINIFNIIQFVR